MKGYIYIAGSGADPAARGNLNDPSFGPIPTLGACMPNIRRVVSLGDYIFTISGKLAGFQQYVVGGMRVAEKIDAMAAYERFPNNRLRYDENGILQGNVVVDGQGRKHKLDGHSEEGFTARIRNFVVGADAVAIASPKEVELARAQTLSKLSNLFGKRGNRVIDVMGRWAKLDAQEVSDVLGWLRNIKQQAR